MTNGQFPTKEQEIEAYREFVRSRPRNSYLADILHGTDDEIALMIRSDISHVMSFSQAWAARQEEEKQVLEIRKRKQALQDEVKGLERQKQRMEREMDEIRSAARVLAMK